MSPLAPSLSEDDKPDRKRVLLPTKRDILTFGAGAAIAGAAFVAYGWNEHRESNDAHSSHLSEKQKRAFINEHADEYASLLRLAKKDVKTTDVYNVALVDAATKLRLLLLCCPDERIEPRRADELPGHNPSSRAETLLKLDGTNGVSLAGSGVLVEGQELEEIRVILMAYIDEIRQKLAIDDPDQALRISRHEKCGACAKKAEELGNVSRADELSWETARKMIRLLQLKQQPLSIGYGPTDLQMRFNPQGHLVLGALTTENPHFRSSEMGLPPMFSINGGFGAKNTNRELDLLFGIARHEKHGLGEDWLRRYPFAVTLQARTPDGIERLHEMVRPTVKNFGTLAKVVHLLTPTT